MARKFYIQDTPVAPSIVFLDVQPLGFSEVTDNDKLKALHVKRYKAAKKEGKEYVFNYTAQLYLDIIAGVITPTDAFLFEQHVVDLLRQIDGGHWLTAQNTNKSITLSGIYDQARKDGLQNDLDNYILNQY
jgi:hypothetical protein